jgi:hemerythrin superfamily protein
MARSETGGHQEVQQMPKNAIDALMTDHREVEELFSKVQAGGPEKDVVEKIVRELSIHDAIERELLYPLVREKIPSEGEGLAEHSLDEHEAVARLLADIEKANDSERATLLNELMTDVKKHVAEEESQVFPKLRTVTTESELMELGQRLEDAKKRAPTHPHPHAPRSGAGAKVAGMAAGAMDRMRDAS